ncbi:MAG: phenylacetate--CoA ligase, partial [Desulfovibrio sp.]
MIFNVEMETMPREELEALQLKRLKYQLERVYANVPFYRKAFDEKNISPADVTSLSDLASLPFTEKQDLRNHYPFGLFAVPKENIVRLHASSGTTGKATVVGYTQRDLDNWAECMARTYMCAG